MECAREADITLHAASARLGDPDSPLVGTVDGIILWRLNPRVSPDEALSKRLMPKWHLCPSAFIPINRCHASRRSLISELASLGDGMVAGSRLEDVSIGSLKGSYRVDAVAWGTVARGTRLVLSAFIHQ
jgi:hypothetical protein